jgi:predicted N-formylglutamate amidohydrolase
VFERLILTCEHGGNRIPLRYARLFARASRVLQSHRGYDIGALRFARRLARRFRAPLYASTTSRLLADLNRSPRNPRCFSEFVAKLPRAEKLRILERHHRPHRERVERAIARFVRRGEPVLHIAVHSFTPVLAGEARRAEVGLLYDPAKPLERRLCAGWKAVLREVGPDLRVRRNYPYRGEADGIQTHLRRLFPARLYAGVELEVNQGVLGNPLEAEPTLEQIERSLAHVLDEVLRSS